MQLANIWLEVNDLHSNANLKNVTPAECLIYRNQFGRKISGQATPTNPITHLALLPDVTRSNDEERTRLCRRFGDEQVAKAFPGDAPQFPLTFKEAGFEVTKDAAPASGKKHEILPLASVGKGDDGSNDAAEVAALKAELAALKAQVNEKPATSKK